MFHSLSIAGLLFEVLVFVPKCQHIPHMTFTLFFTSLWKMPRNAQPHVLSGSMIVTFLISCPFNKNLCSLPHMYSEQIIISCSLFHFFCSYVIREFLFICLFAVVFSCMLCQDSCTSHLVNSSSEPKPIDFPRSLRQQVWPRNSL